MSAAVKLQRFPGAKRLPVSSKRRDAWLAARRQYIGASDSAAILGVDPFRSALDVYLDKRGESAEVEQTEAMEAGNVLERTVLGWYAQRSGRTAHASGMLHVSTEHAHLSCTPDGIVWLDAERTAPAQVKCTGRSKAWDDGLPDHVYIQIQHEMLVLGVEQAVAIALVSTWGGFRLKDYDVERDEGKQREIIEATADMMARIRTGEPPEPDGSAAAGRAPSDRCSLPSPPTSR